MKTIVSLLLFLLLFPFVARAGQQQSDHALKAQLVGALRFLNTEEYEYKSKNGHFATNQELFAWLQQVGKLKNAPPNLTADGLKPFVLTITTSADGDAYQIELLRPSNMKDKSTWCFPAAFSDEGGVIFLGLALGCSAPGQPSAI